MTRVEQLEEVLATLTRESQDVQACALLSNDGLMIASALPERLEDAGVAAMAAGIHALGSRAAKELRRGALEEVVVRGPRGYVLVRAATAGTILLALAEPSSRLGLALLDLRHAAAAVRGVL